MEDIKRWELLRINELKELRSLKPNYKPLPVIKSTVFTLKYNYFNQILTFKFDIKKINLNGETMI